MALFDPYSAWCSLPLLLSGHLALWVGIYNRAHAVHWPNLRKLERWVAIPLFLLLSCLIIPWWYFGSISRGTMIRSSLAAYFGLAMAAQVSALLIWLYKNYRQAKDRRSLVEDLVTVHDWRDQDHSLLGSDQVRRLGQIRGNEILQLHVHRKRLVIPHLPASLEGLTIAHLSDLHFSGRFTQAFYHRVIELVNQAEPDLVVVTGDLVDRRECLAWVGPVFENLRSPLGKYFILGNHDRRIGDPAPLRESLAAAGLQDVGGHWQSGGVAQGPFIIAGDERPWFGSEPMIDDAPENAFRIYLTHTPDRFSHAAEQQFDLVLAGHTHGGQIRFPLIGAIVCPSLYGVRYSSGVFSRLRSVMHVTRGICGVTPLRFGCPPELAILTLTRSATASSAGPSGKSSEGHLVGESTRED